MSELIDPPFGRKNPCEPPRITDGYDFVVINGVRYVRQDKKIPGPATKAMLGLVRQWKAGQIHQAQLGAEVARISKELLAEWES